MSRANIGAEQTFWINVRNELSCSSSRVHLSGSPLRSKLFKGCAITVKSRMYRRKKIHRPIKELISLFAVVVFAWHIYSIAAMCRCSCSNFPGRITFPSYSTFSLKKAHFFILRVAPDSVNVVRIGSVCQTEGNWYVLIRADTKNKRGIVTILLEDRDFLVSVTGV